VVVWGCRWAIESAALAYGEAQDSGTMARKSRGWFSDGVLGWWPCFEDCDQETGDQMSAVGVGGSRWGAGEVGRV